MADAKRWEEELRTSRSTNTRLLAEITGLRWLLGQHKTDEESLKKLKLQNRLLQEQVLQLKEQLFHVSSGCKGASELEAPPPECDSATPRLDVGRLRVERSNSSNTLLRSPRHPLLQPYDSPEVVLKLEADLSAARECMVRYEQSAMELGNEVERCRSQANEAQQQLLSSRLEVARMKQQLWDATTRTESATREIEALKEQLHAVQIQGRQQQGQNERHILSLREQLEAARRRADSEHQHALEVEADLVVLRNRLACHTARIVALTEDQYKSAHMQKLHVDQLTEEIDELAEALEQAEDRCAVAEDEVTHLRASLEMSQHAAATAQAQYEKLRHNLELVAVRQQQMAKREQDAQAAEAALAQAQEDLKLADERYARLQKERDELAHTLEQLRVKVLCLEASQPTRLEEETPRSLSGAGGSEAAGQDAAGFGSVNSVASNHSAELEEEAISLAGGIEASQLAGCEDVASVAEKAVLVSAEVACVAEGAASTSTMVACVAEVAAVVSDEVVLAAEEAVSNEIVLVSNQAVPVPEVGVCMSEEAALGSVDSVESSRSFQCEAPSAVEASDVIPSGIVQHGDVETNKVVEDCDAAFGSVYSMESDQSTRHEEELGSLVEYAEAIHLAEQVKTVLGAITTVEPEQPSPESVPPPAYSVQKPEQASSPRPSIPLLDLSQLPQPATPLLQVTQASEPSTPSPKPIQASEPSTPLPEPGNVFEPAMPLSESLQATKPSTPLPDILQVSELSSPPPEPIQENAIQPAPVQPAPAPSSPSLEVCSEQCGDNSVVADVLYREVSQAMGCGVDITADITAEECASAKTAPSLLFKGEDGVHDTIVSEFQTVSILANAQNVSIMANCTFQLEHAQSSGEYFDAVGAAHVEASPQALCDGCVAGRTDSRPIPDTPGRVVESDGGDFGIKWERDSMLVSKSGVAFPTLMSCSSQSSDRIAAMRGESTDLFAFKAPAEADWCEEGKGDRREDDSTAAKSVFSWHAKPSNIG